MHADCSPGWNPFIEMVSDPPCLLESPFISGRDSPPYPPPLSVSYPLPVIFYPNAILILLPGATVATILGISTHGHATLVYYRADGPYLLTVMLKDLVRLA